MRSYGVFRRYAYQYRLPQMQWIGTAAAVVPPDALVGSLTLTGVGL